MTYNITAYTKRKAKQLGVQIKPSTRKGKKIDVFKKIKNKQGETKLKKLASIGAIGMGDYPTFLKTRGKEYANKRRKAYRSRMAKNIKVVGSAGYYAGNLLW
tara:strand:+ start:410 stop:715 length:306 start_codon:yes stop_codon:yes gene_type:complete